MDNLSPEHRRKNMQAIRSQSKLENKITKELWRKGLRFRKNDRTLLGKPDISIKKYKVAVFIDSCFWHGCEVHGNRPGSNQEYWDKKLARNKNRDKEVEEYYRESGWNYMRLWEHDFKNDFNGAVDKIEQFILKVKKEAG